MPERLTTINIFKGLAILEVVFHHTVGMINRYVSKGSDTQIILTLFHQVFHFAVPAFLFMTALVLTYGASKKTFDVRRFYLGRLNKSLYPYLLWSIIFVGIRILWNEVPMQSVRNPEQWQFWLQYGKASYHLYFLIIALQFYLVFPLLLPVVRKVKSFSHMLLLVIVLQAVVYFLNKYSPLVVFAYPASMALWYIPAIGLGMYFGLHYTQFLGFWQRFRPLIVLCMIIGTLWYVPQGYALLMGFKVNSISYAWSYWLYSTAFAIGLFGFASSWQRPASWVSACAFLGAFSLQVYLMHPIVLGIIRKTSHIWLGWHIPPALMLVLFMGLALFLSLWVAQMLQRFGLSRVLFGR